MAIFGNGMDMGSDVQLSLRAMNEVDVQQNPNTLIEYTSVFHPVINCPSFPPFPAHPSIPTQPSTSLSPRALNLVLVIRTPTFANIRNISSFLELTQNILHHYDCFSGCGSWRYFRAVRDFVHRFRFFLFFPSRSRKGL